MRNIIIILLLLPLIGQTQTKWRQIERSLTKWNVPAAYDSIPGQPGYAGKWIALTALLDSLGIDSTVVSAGFGLTSSESPANTWNIAADSSKLATQHDISGFVDGTGTATRPAFWSDANTLTSDSNLDWNNTDKRLLIGPNTAATTPNKLQVVGAGSIGQYIMQVENESNVTSAGGINIFGNNTNTSFIPLNTNASTTGSIIINHSNSNTGNGSAYINTSVNGTSNAYLVTQKASGTAWSLGMKQTETYAGRFTISESSTLTAAGERFSINTGGTVRIKSLDTDAAAPVTSGTTRAVITDGNGDLSFTTFPSGLDSTVVSAGYGLTATESPANTFTVSADTSKLVTFYDLSQVDQSATNELQTISSSGAAGNITLSNGGGTLTLNVNDADASATNELQKIDTFQIFDTNKLQISLQNDGEAAKVVTLPTTIDSTNVTQGFGVIVTESPANTFNIKSDTTKLATLYDVSLVDQSASNELQTISTNGSAGNITLSNGGGTLNLNVNDADSSPTNEIQNISTNGAAGNITISSGSTLTLNVNDADASITNEIQTIDTFEIFDTNKLRISLSQDGQAAKVVTLPTSGGSGIDSTIVAAGWGIDVTESPANTFTVKADTAEVATQYDLTLKQDKLVSGTNIKTVNSNSLLGSGNVSVGTVTSIGTSAPISGGTITGSGTIGLNYDSNTLTLSGINLIARNGSAIWNADKLQNTTIKSTLSPSIGSVLTYTASNQWEAKAPPAGTTNLTFSGASSPFTLNSDTGSDVTIAAGDNVTLSRSSNQLTISSTVPVVQTWADVAGDVISWGSTGTFNSGKQVGIGTLNAARLLDVNGDAQLRGAIYNSSNSAGSSGQVLTSNGTSAWSWATPADGSATNEAQTLSLGSNGAVNLTAVSGSGGGSYNMPSHTFGTVWATSNKTALTLDGTNRTLTYDSSLGNNTSQNTGNGTITINTTGTYRIEYSGSYYADAGGYDVWFEIFKNGSYIGYVGQCRTDETDRDIVNYSRSFIADLIANDVISLTYYRPGGGSGPTISFYNINLTVQRIN